MTSPTRRTFLRTGALAAVAAGIALSPARLAFGQDTKTTPSQDFEIPYEAKLDPVFSYTKATFDPYVGGVFTTRGTGGKRVEMTLVAVHGQSTTTRTAVRSGETVSTALTSKARPVETFTLVFHAAGPLSDLSTIYQIEHAALGKFSLFLVRTKDEKDKEVYEAVISRLAQ
ncbi:MAG TPA: twin-arginine translocation signal domain-containing protein [Pyrinomonadaceae bacterium]|nr:twin-arginine translocation signal domain-containing protein [Pyrinomonadaceae bacterium]